MQPSYKVVKTLEYISDGSICFTQGKKYDIIKVKNAKEIKNFCLAIDDQNDIVYVAKQNFKTV